MMTNQLFTTQKNHYSLTINKLGLKETLDHLMPRWERTIGLWTQDQKKENSQQRKRQIIWFNHL